MDPSTAELLAHARWIETLALRLVADRASADDIVQNTWLAALRTGSKPRGNVRGWLARIAGNVAREAHRRESQRADVEQSAARDERLPSSAELASRAEAETKLVEAVLALEDPHREVLLLRYFEGLEPAEIARRSGVPASSVSKRLTRAHAQLRSKLEEGGVPWLAALAPIVARPPTVPPLLVPILVMSTTVKILVPAAVLAALALWMYTAHDEPPAIAAPAVTDAPREKVVASDPLAIPNSETTERASAIESRGAPPPKDVAQAPQAETVAAEAPAHAETGRIHGRVIRPDGKPAPNRKVRLLRTPGGPLRPVTTDDQGRFDERELPIGKWSVSTQCSKEELAALGFPPDTMDLETLAQRILDLHAGGDIEVELGAPPASPIRVSGRIVADALPSGVVMQWVPDGEDGFDRAAFKRSRDDGSYEVILAEPGPYSVSMIIANCPRAERLVDVPRASAFTHDFELATGAIRGRVHNERGDPISRAAVDLTIRAGRRPITFMSSFGYTKTTDAEGRFAFERLDPALYTLSIHGGAAPGGEAAAAFTVPRVAVVSGLASEELDLVAPTGDVVRGRVTDASGGPINYTNLFVFDAHGDPLDPIVPVTTDKQGAFKLQPLAPGHYALVGAAGMRWTEFVPLDVSAQQAASDVELHLSDAAVLEVTGESLGDSWIEVRDTQGHDLSSVLDRNLFNGAITRANFRFKWRYRVPAGDYEVRAIDGTGAAAASTRVSAGAGATKIMTLSR